MTRWSRREVLKWAAGAGAAALLPQGMGCQRSVGQGPPMNVLFISIDDLRPQLGCYGQAGMVTPNIDRLAAEGARFTRAYCQQAVCAPSRASVMTGCRPDTTGVFDLVSPLDAMRPDLVTLPRHFRDHGYHAEAAGKIYHHAQTDDPDAWSAPHFRAPGRWEGYVLAENLEGPSPGPPTEIGDRPANDYRDAQGVTHLIERMRQVKDQPFFLGAGFARPHLPFAAPRECWDLYDPQQITLNALRDKPVDAPDIAMHDWPELRGYVGVPKTGPLSDEQARHLIYGYYAAISFLDGQVGRLLAALDELGLAENTVVVLWTDHGFHLGEHGLWCKHSNFETATHVPLIVRAPGHPRGLTIDSLVELVDIFPTLCELTGLPAPAHLEGASLTPLLRNPGSAWKQAAFSQYPRDDGMGYSIRTQRYRFTRWPDEADGSPRHELYDYEADPDESRNLANLAEHQQTVRELSEQLDMGWRAAVRQG